MRISVLGTGTMGAALTEVLIKAGHTVLIYNRTLSKTKSLVTLGAVVVTTVSEAIESTDATIIVLPDAKSTRELVFSEMTRTSLFGRKLLNASTTQPDEIVELEQEMLQYGANLAEVSLMAGAEQLRNQQGQFILGCNSTDKAFWMELLQSIGTQVDYAGNTGDASKAELPILIASMFGVVTTAYAVAAAQKLNIPKSISEHYIPTFVPGSEYLLPKMLTHNYDECLASTNNFTVVSTNAINSAKSIGLPTNILSQMQELFIASKLLGFGEKDASSIYEVLLNPQFIPTNN